LAALLLAAADPAAAQKAGTNLRRFLYGDATATLHLRSYYLDRTNPSPPDNVAWAGRRLDRLRDRLALRRRR